MDSGRIERTTGDQPVAQVQFLEPYMSKKEGKLLDSSFWYVREGEIDNALHQTLTGLLLPVPYAAYKDLRQEL